MIVNDNVRRRAIGKRLINLNRNTALNTERQTGTIRERRQQMTASVRAGRYTEEIAPLYTPPAENRYVIKLDDWDEPKPSNYPREVIDEDGDTITTYPLRINLKFKIVKDIEGDTEFAGKDVNKWCALDLNPNDKTSVLHVMQALDPSVEFGPDMDDDDPRMELDYYRGKTCKGDVEHTIKPNKQGVMTTYSNVGKVYANKAKKEPAAAKVNPLLKKDEDDE